MELYTVQPQVSEPLVWPYGETKGSDKRYR